MKNMMKFAAILLVLTMPVLSMGQNCANFVRYYTPEHPFKYSSLSKSASCMSAKSYKFVIPLNAGKVYRISFYASTVFDNRIDFKIIDKNSGETVMYLPGDKTVASKTDYLASAKFTQVLLPEVDPNTFKQGPYPYFELEPATSTNIQVEIEVGADPKGATKRGCIGVLVQDKLSDASGSTGF